MNAKYEIILPGPDIAAEKRRLRFFPKRRMLILKSFKDGFHYGFPQKFRFVFNAVAAAVNTKRPGLTVIEHQRKPVFSFLRFLFSCCPFQIEVT